MNAHEVERILATSSPDDWIRDNETEISFTYKHDLHIHIEKDQNHESEYHYYKSASNKSYENFYIVKYNSSFVLRVTMIDYDNHHVILPKMIAENKTVLKRDVNIARILDNHPDLVISTLKGLGITIV